MLHAKKQQNIIVLVQFIDKNRIELEVVVYITPTFFTSIHKRTSILRRLSSQDYNRGMHMAFLLLVKCEKMEIMIIDSKCFRR